MAFAKEAVRTPVAVGDIRIITLDAGAGSVDVSGTPVQDSISYSLWVIYSDGSRKHLEGNLAPHLTPTQINGAIAFAAAVRQIAEAQLLP